MQNPGRLHHSLVLVPRYVLLTQKDFTPRVSYKQLSNSELTAVGEMSKICPWSLQLPPSKGLTCTTTSMLLRSRLWFYLWN